MPERERERVTKLFVAFGDATALESVTFKAAAVMAPLLLQQPLGKASYGENRKHLARRLALWEAGDIAELLRGHYYSRAPRQIQQDCKRRLALKTVCNDGVQ